MGTDLNPRLFDLEPLRRCRLEECGGACCQHGAWVDAVEARQILANRTQILPHLDHGSPAPEEWFEAPQEPDENALAGRVWHTLVLADELPHGGTACVFLRRDAKCALQLAAEAAAFHPWYWKPFYCILHPLDLDEQGRITLDETAALLAEPASCVRRTGSLTPLTATFAPELRYLLGDKEFQRLAGA
jgi:hypothetical protein